MPDPIGPVAPEAPVTPAAQADPIEARRGRARGYALAILAAACWATGGVLAKWMFTSAADIGDRWVVPPLGISVDPTTLSGGRALAACGMLLVYLLITRRNQLSVSVGQIPFLAFFGIVGLAGVHYTYFKTISLTNVATAILLEYLAPVVVLAFSVLFLKERPSWRLPAGVALSVTGCAFVVGAIGGDGLAVTPAGIAWGLSSAVFFAVYSLMGAYAARRYTPWTLLVWGLGFAALFWLLVLGPSSVLALFASARTAVAVLFMAFVSTVVPFGAFLKALHYIEPTRATVTATLEPVIAGVVAFALFGEVFGASQLLGGALVIGAIIVTQAVPARSMESV